MSSKISPRACGRGLLGAAEKSDRRVAPVRQAMPGEINTRMSRSGVCVMLRGSKERARKAL